MRARRIDLLLVAGVLATSGCADLLGVEEVSGEGGGGGGDAAWEPGGVGAGLSFPMPGTGASPSGGGGDVTSDAGSSGTAGGGACGAVLPACSGAVPSSFEGDADLDLAFDRDGDSDEIDVSGGRLELEPRRDDDDDDDGDDEGLRYAAVKSKNPIVPGAAPCAIWVELVESGSDLAAGLAVGPGSPWEDDYRIERRGVVIAARVGGSDHAHVPYVEDVTRYLRIRFEAGMVTFDVSADASCWNAVGPPVPMAASEGLVRLHAEGESGKARLDGYCL